MAEDDALLERKRAELAPIRTRFDAIFRELYPDQSAPNYSSNLPVLPALRKYVEEHKKFKDEHEKLLQSEADIRREERQLCHELNEISLENDRENFQSKQLVTQMSLLSEHIRKLKEEKVCCCSIVQKKKINIEFSLSFSGKTRRTFNRNRSNIERIRRSLRMETT